MQLKESLASWKPGRMRVLIAGAGIAGLTLASLLRRQGVQPLLVERAADGSAGGYSVGIYPIGSRVLHGLGLHDAFMDVSADFATYQLHNGHGDLVQTYEMSPIFSPFGPLRGLRRAELIEILRQGIGDTPVHYATTVTQISQSDSDVTATFSDGSSASFDVLVGADGMHSATRSQVLDKSQYKEWDTHWGCWVEWIDAGVLDAGAAAEYWGAGNFLGLYPVKGAVMACAALPKSIMDGQGTVPADAVRSHFGDLSKQTAPVLDALSKDAKPFFWDLHDYRSHQWSSGRVVLVGDAACGFLPTAGIGATMAMNGAAVLADELSRTDGTYAKNAIALYEKRQKHRTESAQDKSRELGQMMFLSNRAAAWGRDHLLKYYTPHQFAHDTVKLLDQLS